MSRKFFRAPWSSNTDHSTTFLPQIFLIAVPLVAAPFAFIVSGDYGGSSSLGLEYLLIGFLTLEFVILFLFNQSFFSVEPIFDGSEPVLEIEILNLSCLECSNEFETEKRDVGVEITCPKCGASSCLET